MNNSSSFYLPFRCVLIRVLAPVCLLVTGLLPAQTADVEGADAFVFGVEARLRYEVKDGAGGNSAIRDFRRTGVDNENDYLFLRSTFSVDWQAQQSLQFRLAVRDNRIWGDDRDPSPRAVDLDIYEAYLQWQIAERLDLRLGRQEINMGSRLFIGVGNNNNGTSYDGARLFFQEGRFKGSLMVAKPLTIKRSDWNSSRDTPWLTGAVVAIDQLPGRQTLEVGVYSQHARASQPGGSRDLWGMALRLLSNRSHAPWDWELEAAYQGGHFDRAGIKVDQQAWLFFGKLGYRLSDVAWQPRLGLELHYSPGDSDPRDVRSKTWNLWYMGGMHARVGRMDLVSVRNLQSLGATLNARPSKQLNLGAAVYQHFLDTSADFFYPAGGGGRNGGGFGLNPDFSRRLGTEINFTAKYDIRKDLSLYLEAGTFLRGRYINQSLAAVGGARNANYLQVNLTYHF